MGAIVMIVGIVLIVMIHESGHFLAAKAFNMKATEYFLGFGPRLWSFRRGETEYGIKAIPAGGYVKIIGMSPLEEVDPAEEHRTYRGKPFWQKSIVVMAGIASHFVVAFVLLWFAAVVVGTPDVDAPQTQVAGVVAVLDDDATPTPAAAAGLREGDRFVAVDGVEVTDWEQFTGMLQARPDEAVVLTIERDGETLETSVTLAARTIDGEMRGFLGVWPAVPQKRENPIAAIGTSIDDIGTITVQSVEGIGTFIAGFGDFVNSVFTEDELADDERPVSVVGLVRFGAEDQIGMDFLLRVLALFSIFVGVLNAIPLYPFDGGHFMVALWEKITGRTPDVTKLVPVSAAIFLFLMVLGLLAIYFDIVDPIELGN